MAFFKRNDIGRLYVIKMVLPDDTVVHKIGMCNSNRATDRMMEILKSWFLYFRFVPYSELKLDLQCDHAIKIEKYIHTILNPSSFIPDYKVEGRTEMFTGINENRLIWFIKNCQNSMHVDFPKLSKKEADAIHDLLTI